MLGSTFLEDLANNHRVTSCDKYQVEVWHDLLDETLDLGSAQESAFALFVLEKEKASFVLNCTVKVAHRLFIIVDSMA